MTTVQTQYHTIRKTRRGYYLLRDWAGREMGQYRCLDEAIAARDRIERGMEEQQARRDQQYEIQSGFLDRYPNLLSATLEWQRHRIWLYREMLALCRQRNNDVKRLLSMAEPPEYIGNRAIRSAEDTRLVAEDYEHATQLDREMKSAMANCDAVEWQSALERIVNWWPFACYPFQWTEQED